jgi:CoA:oxalate CoA-transferase
VAILENAIARYLSTGEVPKPLGSRHSSFTPFETFETQDGYAVLAIGNDNLWAKFCAEVGCPQLIHDERFKTNALRTEYYDELRPILENIMKTRTTDQWVEEMEKAGIPCGPINTIDKVVQQPQIQAREMIVEVEHKSAGKVKMAGVPIKLSDTPGKVESPAPDLGEHTSEVLSELLGLSDEEITKLRKDDVI